MGDGLHLRPGVATARFLAIERPALRFLVAVLF
jgi:hypothetical protein